MVDKFTSELRSSSWIIILPAADDGWMCLCKPLVPFKVWTSEDKWKVNKARNLHLQFLQQYLPTYIQLAKTLLLTLPFYYATLAPAFTNHRLELPCFFDFASLSNGSVHNSGALNSHIPSALVNSHFTGWAGICWLRSPHLLRILEGAASQDLRRVPHHPPPPFRLRSRR